MGCHGSAHTARRPESIRTLGPRAPPPAPRSASTAVVGDAAQRTPQPRGRSAPGRCVPSSASSAPPPPPGASARAEPDGHPGTGGGRASRTSLELGDRRCPQPRGTLGALKTTGRVSAARRGLPSPSVLALRRRSERPSAPLEEPELAGTPPRAPRWYDPPPFKGSALGRRCLQPCRVQIPAPGTPALQLGPQRRPGAAGLCGKRAVAQRLRCFCPPLRGLPSETSGSRKGHCFNFAFSFEFSTQETSVYTTSLLGQHADYTENNQSGKSPNKLKELLPSPNKSHDAKQRFNKRSKVQSKLRPTRTSGMAASLA